MVKARPETQANRGSSVADGDQPPDLAGRNRHLEPTASPFAHHRTGSFRVSNLVDRAMVQDRLCPPALHGRRSYDRVACTLRRALVPCCPGMAAQAPLAPARDRADHALGAELHCRKQMAERRCAPNLAYTQAMPRLPPFGTGLSPVLQWLLLPGLALHLAAGAG